MVRDIFIYLSIPLTSEHSVLKLGVQSSSILSHQVGSHPSRFTMPLLSMSTVISFGNQNMFENFTRFGPLRFSGVVDEDSYEFLIHCREKFYNLRSLSCMELLILPIN